MKKLGASLFKNVKSKVTPPTSSAMEGALLEKAPSRIKELANATFKYLFGLFLN
jgi:hypothetical protein